MTEASHPVSTPTTRATEVYERLRWDIVQGQLEPGSKLPVEAMCARYGVGASPLREALSRLSAEGWVDRTDLRGFSVTPLNWEEFPILTRNRVQLESIALRESIENRDQEMEDKLVLLMHKLSRIPRSLSAKIYMPNPDWEDVHREFHLTLLSRCPSRWLKAFCASLMDEAYRFRQMAAHQVFAKRDEQQEHLAVFEAVIEGRVDDAVRALEDHYQRTSEIVKYAKRKQTESAAT